MATERMQQELPNCGVRYQRTVWEPQLKSSGEISGIYAGVEIETRDGETAELQRWLNADEVLETSRGGGFQAIVKLLALECLAELPKAATEVEIPIEAVDESAEPVVVTVEPPEPQPEDVEWVLAGLENPPAAAPSE